MIMPKHGQRQTDSPGRNDPTKSEEIVTGSYKKQETYREQAAAGEDPGKPPQATKVPHAGPHQGMSAEASSRLQGERGTPRSGSDSRAHGGRKHERNRGTLPAQPPGESAGISEESLEHDLHPHFLAGQNQGLAGHRPEKEGRPATEIKALHGLLPGLSNDELSRVVVLPPGSRLAQGAVYFDLRHPENGEFTATADMEVPKRAYMVAKRETDYVLWNRLRGITDPARLDQSE